MHIVADMIVVIHGAAGIQDNGVPKLSTCINDSSGTDHGAGAYLHIGGYNRLGVLGKSESSIFLLEQLEDSFSSFILTYRNNDGIMLDIMPIRNSAHNRHVKKSLPQQVMAVIQKPYGDNAWI
jgi:hypothetical protein